MEGWAVGGCTWRTCSRHGPGVPALHRTFALLRVERHDQEGHHEEARRQVQPEALACRQRRGRQSESRAQRWGRRVRLASAHGPGRPRGKTAQPPCWLACQHRNKGGARRGGRQKHVVGLVRLLLRGGRGRARERWEAGAEGGTRAGQTAVGWGVGDPWGLCCPAAKLARHQPHQSSSVPSTGRPQRAQRARHAPASTSLWPRQRPGSPGRRPVWSPGCARRPPGWSSARKWATKQGKG